MKFIKVAWILSVFVVLIFNITFEGFRILDFISKNYVIKTMKVSDYSYNTNSRRKSLTIMGHIGDEKVYFSRFGNEIEKLYSLYPNITNTKNNVLLDIQVLKFNNSHKVMLIKDNEFHKWKTYLYLSALYSVISIIILILIKK